jgi:hypothetical protein
VLAGYQAVTFTSRTYAGEKGSCRWLSTTNQDVVPTPSRPVGFGRKNGVARGGACAAAPEAPAIATDRLAATACVSQNILMRNTLFSALALALLSPATASATWSVIAVDMATGRIVIASATCVNRDAEFLKNIQAVIVPGKGIAACQAAVDGTHTNQMLVYNELMKGTDPARIIEMLAADPAFQSRQFGIVDLTGRSAGHSGLTNGYVSQDVQGRVPGTQIFYSIQGNILRPGDVVPAAVKAFVENKGALTDRVMAAMEAADGAGGDSRCTCAPPANPPTQTTAPLAPIPANLPCEGRTSYIAYITMAESGDKAGPASHSDGRYAMYITVAQPELGGPHAIKAGENLNPVKTLRMRYDTWRKAQPRSYR